MSSGDPITHRLVPGAGSATYMAFLLVALFVAAWWWSRRFRADPRLIAIFAGAVVGAFAGAFAGFWLAEGWVRWTGGEAWTTGLAAGKTVLGALLGGYAGVELMKRAVGFGGTTGDSFAAVVPLGIAFGRLGCLAHGCCLGRTCAADRWFALADRWGTPRWPAPVAEIAFNLAAFAVFFSLRRHGVLPGQHFHLYLIGYGLFRFAHEFLRDTPRVSGAFTGYHVLALMVVVLGVTRLWRRARGAVVE
jgi:phosphatidylglycerol:prolipoprotein diacylglycerol transferase